MVGIPLDVLAGLGGIGITLRIVSDMMIRLTMIPVPLRLRISPYVVGAAVVLSLITVLLSAWIPSARAKRVTAIEAIRQSRDVRGFCSAGERHAVHGQLLPGAVRRIWILPAVEANRRICSAAGDRGGFKGRTAGGKPQHLQQEHGVRQTEKDRKQLTSRSVDRVRCSDLQVLFNRAAGVLRRLKNSVPVDLHLLLIPAIIFFERCFR